MRLLHATISGFGNWVDETIDFQGEPLVCIYGENEAGKSTIRAFILFMLFGLSPRRRAFYRPKTSSRMGGRLLIADEAVGEYTIERFDEMRNGQAICYTPDGEAHGEEWLQKRLGGMTYNTYQSIFSFAASDLYGIETMTEADLGDVLLSIGLTGSKNILSIEKQLDEQMGNLFKPSGKNPAINQQLNKLESIFHTLHEHKDDEAAYREKKRHIQTLNEKMKALEESHSAQEKEHLLLEKQKQTLPLIEDYTYCTRQLDAYPDSLYFPENGLERLRQLNEKVLPLKSQSAVLQENDNEYQRKQQTLRETLHDESVYSHAEEIRQTKPAYEETKQAIKRNQEALEKEATKLHTELDQLQIGLSPDDLQKMTLPFYLEKTWNELRQTNEQLRLEKEQLEDERVFLENKMNDITTEQKEIEGSLPSEEEVKQLTEKTEAFRKQERESTRVQKATDDRFEWRQFTKRKRKQSYIILTVSGVLAALLVFIALMSQEVTPFLIPAVLVFAAGIAQWIWQKQTIQSLAALFENDADQPMETSVTTEEKAAADQTLNDAKDKQQSLNTLAEQKKQFDIQMMQWEERNEGWKRKDERHEKQIHEQYEAYPFLQKMKLTYWPELFHTLRNLIQSLQKQLRLQEDIDELKAKQETYIKQPAVFCEEHGLDHVKDQPDTSFEQINKLLESYQENSSYINQMDEWIKKNIQSQVSVEQQIKTYEKAINALYKQASVETAEEFYKKASDVDEKNKWLEKKEQLEHQITSTLGDSEFRTMLTGSFHALDLEEALETSDLKMDEWKKEMNAIRNELAAENAALSNMELSDDLSVTAHRFQMEREQLQKWGYDWAVLKTAKTMLTETKSIFRDKYLPEVIEQTSDFFRTITGEQYTRIFAPGKDNLFQVESSDLIRYNVQELSKGTIDQLYISLRLSISEVLSQDTLLPFIMDDAFVHFDSIRTERMMHIVAKLASKQQIIVFTNDWDIFQSEQATNRIHFKNVARERP